MLAGADAEGRRSSLGKPAYHFAQLPRPETPASMLGKNAVLPDPSPGGNAARVDGSHADRTATETRDEEAVGHRGILRGESERILLIPLTPQQLGMPGQRLEKRGVAFGQKDLECAGLEFNDGAKAEAMAPIDHPNPPLLIRPAHLSLLRAGLDGLPVLLEELQAIESLRHETAHQRFIDVVRRPELDLAQKPACACGKLPVGIVEQPAEVKDQGD